MDEKQLEKLGDEIEEKIEEDQKGENEEQLEEDELKNFDEKSVAYNENKSQI